MANLDGGGRETGLCWGMSAPPVPPHSWGNVCVCVCVYGGLWPRAEEAGAAARCQPLGVMNGAVPPPHGAFDLPPPRGEGARGIKDIFVALENLINAISPAAGSPTPSARAKLGEELEAGTRGHAGLGCSEFWTRHLLEILSLRSLVLLHVRALECRPWRVSSCCLIYSLHRHTHTHPLSAPERGLEEAGWPGNQN
jgi:hypothetical protein